MFASNSGFFCMKRWALIETWVPMRILTFSCATAAPLTRTAVQRVTSAKRRWGFIGSSSLSERASILTHLALDDHLRVDGLDDRPTMLSRIGTSEAAHQLGVSLSMKSIG